MNPISLRKRTMLNRTLLIIVGAFVAFAAILALASRSEPTPAQAATEQQGYIKFDALDGEATDADHLDWSNITEVAQGGSKANPVIVIGKLVDTTSTALNLSWLTGKHYANVYVHLTKPGPAANPAVADFYTMHLTNVVVKDYEMEASGGQQMEVLQLTFFKLWINYRAFDPSGTTWTPWFKLSWVNY